MLSFILKTSCVAASGISAAVLIKKHNFLLRSMTVICQKIATRLYREQTQLVQDLSPIYGSKILVVCTDMPFNFNLTLNAESFSVEVVAYIATDYDVMLSGSVVDIISMLDSQGDEQIMSSLVEITGDAEVVVSLRRALARQKIDILAACVSLFGPYAANVRVIIDILVEASKRLGTKIFS